MILKKEIDNTFYSTRIETYPTKYTLFELDNSQIGEYLCTEDMEFISCGGFEYTLKTKKRLLKNTIVFLMLSQEKILEMEIYDNWQVWPLSIIGRIDFENSQYNIVLHRNEKTTFKHRKLQYYLNIKGTDIQTIAEINFEIECHNVLPINMHRIGYQGEITIKNMNLIIPLTVLKLIEMNLYQYDYNANRND